MELPGRRSRERPEEIYGCNERGYEASRSKRRRGCSMEADDSLWQPLKGKAEKDKKKWKTTTRVGGPGIQKSVV